METSFGNIPENVSILVVDDESTITAMISSILRRSGYNCMIAERGSEALKLLSKHAFDVVLTDIRMPGMDGVELLKKIKSEYNSEVIVMSGFTDEYDYQSIITAGADDFIQKPLSFRELFIRLKKVLRLRYLLIERDRTSRKLEENIKQLVNYSNELENAHHELKYAYLDTINRLVAATEYKDEDTGDHVVRISRYSSLIAEKMGLPAEMVSLIQYASPMHDIGKIGIPDHILLKPDRLTKEEFEVVKTHTTIGASILDNTKAEVLNLGREIALTHHEKYNGRGYPKGLSGKEIPVSGRIIAVADTFDALTSKRPYKNPYPIDIALNIIISERGEHFDPEIVDVFIKNIDAITRIREEVASIDIIDPADFIWSGRDIAADIDTKIMRVARGVETKHALSS
jgi:putative two-component system response regulator